MSRSLKRQMIFSRKDFYDMILGLTMIGMLIFRIPLWHMIGDKGMAYFAVTNEIYLAIAGAAAYGLSKAVEILVKYRVRREQFKSAGKVLKGALILGGSIGLLLSILLGFFGQLAARNILHLPFAGLAVCLMAPSLFFLILTEILKGYFQGNGSRMPSMHSQILQMVFLYVGGLMGAKTLRGYGEKVSALLRNEDHIGAYGAMGASAGFLAASVICFLYMLVLYFIYSSSRSRQTGREMQKGQDAGLHLLYMLVGTGAVYSLFWLCFYGLPFADQYLFLRSFEETGEAALQWGAYYGKYLVLVGVVSSIVSMFCLGSVRRITSLIDKEDPRAARERLGMLVHQCAAFVMPGAVLLAVYSEGILELLFPGNQQQTASWVQLGSVVVLLSVFAAVFMDILVKGRKIKQAAVIGAGAFLLHILLLLFLLNVAKIGMRAVIISNIVFYLLVLGAGFFLVSRSIQYTQEWLRSLALPALLSAISGIIAMLLNKAFLSVLGTASSLVISLLAAIAAYLLLLVVTRAFRGEELEEMPGGRILIALAGILHIS